ncbi:MAG: TonB-dependent receptor [Flavobacteriales bacterium]|nr:TonB-dependent receptor [Flavobacteriales bacterium]
MKKLYHIFIFLLTILSVVSNAQVLTVRDKVTLEVLSGALVTISGHATMSTDGDGMVDLGGLRAGSGVVVSAIGYETDSVSWQQLETSSWIVGLTARHYLTGEVVVSANRTSERRENVPQHILVLDKKEIMFLSQQNSADVLQSTGNVFVQKSQLGGGSPVLRGFEANKVLLVVDGVRMNNAIYRGGHLQDVMTLDNSVLEKVEVMYGPGSVMYGSDALGGVMHFFTRNPEFSQGDKLLVKGNAFVRHATVNNEMTGHFDLNIGGKRFASFTAVTYSDFGDLRQGNVRSPGMLDVWGRTEYVERIDGKDSIVTNSNPNVQVGSAYKQYDLLQKFSFKQSEFVKHTLNFQYSTSSDVPRYDRLTQYRNGKLRFAEWYYGPQERMLAAWHVDLTKENKAYTSARITASYQALEQSRNTRTRDKSALESQVENVDVIGVNADFNKKAGKHEIRYGAEFVTNDVDSKATAIDIETDSTWKIPTRYPDGGSSMQSLAAYVTHTWNVSPKFTIAEGIRGSNVKLDATFNDTLFFPFPFKSIEQNNTALTGNIGLILKSGHDWRFVLNGSTGFRAPNVDDIAKVFESTGAERDENGVLVTPGNLIIPNPKLKPEYTYNVDLGIAKTIDKVVTLEGTGFYTWYQNALTTDASALNGDSLILFEGDTAMVSTTVNKAKAYVYGFNGQLVAKVHRNFEITSAINYTYARIEEEDGTETPLDHIPPVFGRTSFNLKLKKFRGEFWVMYNGWKRIEDYRLNAEDNEANATALGMPSWYTINLRTSYQINEHLTAQLAIENILDQNYRMFASNISAPGRNLMVTLRARF